MGIRKTLLITVLYIFTFAACSSNDEATTYEKAEFYGSWELSSSTSENFVVCTDNPLILDISENEIFFSGIDSGTWCNSGSSLQSNYDFNGSVFTIHSFSVDAPYTITSKHKDEFTWERNLGAKPEVYTYIKLN
ncbi:hypothetical protein JKA74_13105 [Marivirga sp. S37H4]|uniref:Lipocalin-like domain-containing protein n=1 Tax=Marivirga aurantiaca TaxID=2802615 RepID=A0A935C9G4_9BACT|nr:hypothetical protein [Marivirga aurantiaca]MBK6265974.1 hypothetical protein [Marivirga aurantiaca]